MVVQLSELCFNGPEPEATVASARSFDHDVVFKFIEKVCWLEEICPGSLSFQDAPGDLHRLLALGPDELAVRPADVDRRVHLRDAGGDDGHGVLGILGVHDGVPGRVRLGLLDSLEVDRLGPLPLGEHVEERIDEEGNTSHSALNPAVLADVRHQDGPGGPTEEAQHVTVQSIFFGPQLDDA